MWTPAGNDRYTWTHQPDGAGVSDPARPRRLLDPGDGSLIEADGSAVLRYPTGRLDSEGLIVNESGQCQVVQNSQWDPQAEDEFWSHMAEVSDAGNPFWEGARNLGQDKPEPPRSKKADSVPATPPALSE